MALTTVDLTFQICLDRQFTLTGVYDGTYTSWTLPMTDATIDAIVLGTAITGREGEVLAPFDIVGAVVRAFGDFSAGDCILGRIYSYSLQLSQPFKRDERGIADHNDKLWIKSITSRHHGTGNYSIRSSLPDRTDRAKFFDPMGIVEGAGNFVAWHNGPADKLDVFIETVLPQPIHIYSVEYLARFSPR